MLKRIMHRVEFYTHRKLKAIRRNFRGESTSEQDVSVFIFGCQRSGTTMLGEVFALDPASDVYPEKSSLGRADDPKRLRLKTIQEVKEAFARNDASLIVIKPLVESQNCAALLSAGSTFRGVWMYRDFRDVVRSNLKLFGDDNGEKDLEAILSNIAGNWRSEHVEADERDLLSGIAAAKLGRNDAAALFWYSRNNHFFRQKLDENDRMWLCPYEAFVADPTGEMTGIYAFLGRSAPRALSNNRVRVSSVGRGAAIDLSPDVERLCDEMLARLHGARAKQVDRRKQSA